MRRLALRGPELSRSWPAPLSTAQRYVPTADRRADAQQDDEAPHAGPLGSLQTTIRTQDDENARVAAALDAPATRVAGLAICLAVPGGEAMRGEGRSIREVLQRG